MHYSHPSQRRLCKLWWSVLLDGGGEGRRIEGKGGEGDGEGRGRREEGEGEGRGRGRGR